MFLNVCVCFMETLSSLYRYVENEWDRKKKHKIFAHIQLLIIVVHFVVCLLVCLVFFKSLKIALLENFSRFFGIYLQTSKPEIFVLQGQMCVLLSILLKSVCTVCYCL